MYGFDDDENFLRLLGFNLPEEQSLPTQSGQGLLGSVDDKQQPLQDIISRGTNAANQLGRFAQSANQTAGKGANLIANRQASTHQAAQQAAAQQQQQEAQQQQLLLKLAMMFI